MGFPHLGLVGQTGSVGWGWELFRFPPKNVELGSCTWHDSGGLLARMGCQVGKSQVTPTTPPCAPVWSSHLWNLPLSSEQPQCEWLHGGTSVRAESPRLGPACIGQGPRGGHDAGSLSQPLLASCPAWLRLPPLGSSQLLQDSGLLLSTPVVNLRGMWATPSQGTPLVFHATAAVQLVHLMQLTKGPGCPQASPVAAQQGPVWVVSLWPGLIVGPWLGLDWGPWGLWGT